MRKQRKRWYHRLYIAFSIAIINSLLLLTGILYTAAAEEQTDIQPVLDARSGIVRVESVCWDGESVVYEIRRRSGFLIGSGSSGPYVVTSCENLTYSKAEQEEIARKNALEENEKPEEKIEIVLQGDVRISASVLTSSEQKNIAVLALDRSLSQSLSLKFAQEEGRNAGQVYLLGFEDGLAEEKNEIYKEETVTIEEGSISQAVEKNEVIFLSHSIAADGGCIGGPLVDGKGCIIGMYLKGQGKNPGRAVEGAEIREMLDACNIAYQVWEEAQKEKRSIFIPILGIVAGILLVILAFQLIRSRKYKRKQTAAGKKESSGKKNQERKQEIESVKGPRLLHISIRETVPLPDTVFVLGSSGTETNYRISGNRRVSRVHARIFRERRRFYIEDMNSKNHTYVNEQILTPGEARMLRDGDKILLADEVFIFRNK